jgi:sodium-dependent dicarboxylate transporter 2/3/5
VEDAAILLLDNLCEQPLIDKHRHKEVHFGKTWEIDVFHGDERGPGGGRDRAGTRGRGVRTLPAWVGARSLQRSAILQLEPAEEPLQELGRPDPPAARDTTMATEAAHDQNRRLMDLLGMDRMSLSSKPREAQDRTEKWMRYLGFPGGILLFLAILYLPPGAGLSASAQAGAACFALALVWWVTEPFPTYVTSLVLMFLLLVTRVATDKAIMYVLGMDVIWLNLLAFILSSMLVKVKLAKRMALWLILRFGRKASHALVAFLILHMILAPLIPATAARAVMTLPLIVVVAAIYGATEENNNNFGRNLLLLNLCCISILSSMTMTGSAANLIAVGMIQTMADQRVYYVDWVKVGAPIAVATMFIMWWIGQKLLYRIPAAEQVPQLEGGLGLVREQYETLGPLTKPEKKAIAIFGLVLASG